MKVASASRRLTQKIKGFWQFRKVESGTSKLTLSERKCEIQFRQTHISDRKTTCRRTTCQMTINSTHKRIPTAEAYGGSRCQICSATILFHAGTLHA